MRIRKNVTFYYTFNGRITGCLGIGTEVSSRNGDYAIVDGVKYQIISNDTDTDYILRS